MKEIQWKIRESMPQEFAKAFPEFNRPLLQLFWNRNLRTKESIYKFLNPALHHLHHPKEMLNMERAVQRINEVIKNQERIAIYGDYDTDGVCSTSILAKTFQTLDYHNFDVYIPNRFRGGYGLTEEKIKKMHQHKTNLIITLDCGITDIEEIALAKQLGMEVIIFDHHLVPDKLPDTLIVDPWQKNDQYPFKDLVASGISYKLAMFLLETNHHPLKPILEKQFLDLVAIATIADVAPLIDENRIFVSEGLKQLVKTQNIGLRKLLEIVGLNPKTKLDPYHVGFIIAPRLNAVGRVEHKIEDNIEETDYSFELLMTENENEAEFLARKVNDLNLERQNKVQEIYDAIKKELSQRSELDKIIFLGNPNWSKGVIGIVAGRLKDEFNRPVFIYSEGKEISTGSARSINGFNLVELIGRYQDLFIEAGGHRLAAGFSLKNENLQRLREILQEEGSNIKDVDLIPKLIIDTSLDPDEITSQFLEIFYRFEPFGRENPEPVFLMSDVVISDIRIVGNSGKHIKFSIQKKNRYFNVISFNNAEQLKFLKSGSKADVIFSLRTEEWGGQQFLEFQLLGLKEK